MGRPQTTVLSWLLSLVLCACGSVSSPNDAASAGRNTAGSASAGTDAGGSTSAGTDAGGNANAGSHRGGAAPTAGNGGNPSGGKNALDPASCHDASECPSGAPQVGVEMCLVPGQTPASPSCGAPQWCGQCSCAPAPVAPAGTGLACQTNQDCPAPSANAASAGVCSAGKCTECAENRDCPSARPACGLVQGQFISSFRMCTECALDEDCPSARPHCQTSGGVPACVACRTTSDCESGICQAGACVPECGSAVPCGALQECNEKQRCEALSCQGNADCPENFACTGGHCGRISCTADSACQGYCVNGFCFEALGSCYLFRAAA